MEADGEPWSQEPSSGSVEYSQQVNILVSSSKEIDTLCKLFLYMYDE